MSKLAVFFPGIGYTVDKPLMYYSRKLAAECGYEIKLLPYGGFPAKILGDAGKMMDSFQLALVQTEKMMAEVDLSAYEDILFVGKSIGTVIAVKTASESQAGDRIRNILYTPLEETFSFPVGRAVAFTGTADPWVGKENSHIPALCAERGIPCFQFKGGNHSLECGDTMKDLKNLKKIMKKTRKAIEEMF